MWRPWAVRVCGLGLETPLHQLPTSCLLLPTTPPLQFAGLGGGTGQSECELTELKAMMGVVGEQRYVAGFLTQVGSD